MAMVDKLEFSPSFSWLNGMEVPGRPPDFQPYFYPNNQAWSAWHNNDLHSVTEEKTTPWSPGPYTKALIDEKACSWNPAPLGTGYQPYAENELCLNRYENKWNDFGEMASPSPFCDSRYDRNINLPNSLSSNVGRDLAPFMAAKAPSDEVVSTSSGQDDLSRALIQVCCEPVDPLSEGFLDQLDASLMETMSVFLMPPQSSAEGSRQGTTGPARVKRRQRSLSVGRCHAKRQAAKPKSRSLSLPASIRGKDVTLNAIKSKPPLDPARRRPISTPPASKDKDKKAASKDEDKKAPKLPLKKETPSAAGQDKGNQTVEPIATTFGPGCCLDGEQREALRELLTSLTGSECQVLMATVTSMLVKRHGQRNVASCHPTQSTPPAHAQDRNEPPPQCLTEEDALCEKYIQKYCGTFAGTNCFTSGSACPDFQWEDESEREPRRHPSSSPQEREPSPSRFGCTNYSPEVNRETSADREAEFWKRKDIRPKLETGGALKCEEKPPKCEKNGMKDERQSKKGNSYHESINNLNLQPKRKKSYSKAGKNMGDLSKRSNSYSGARRKMEGNAKTDSSYSGECKNVGEHPKKGYSHYDACKNMEEHAKKRNSYCEACRNVEEQAKKRNSYCEACRNVEEQAKKRNSYCEAGRNVEEQAKKRNSHYDACRNMEEHAKKRNSYCEACRNMEEHAKKRNSHYDACRNVEEHAKKRNSSCEACRNVEEQAKKRNSYCEAGRNVEEQAKKRNSSCDACRNGEDRLKRGNSYCEACLKLEDRPRLSRPMTRKNRLNQKTLKKGNKKVDGNGNKIVIGALDKVGGNAKETFSDSSNDEDCHSSSHGEVRDQTDQNKAVKVNALALIKGEAIVALVRTPTPSPPEKASSMPVMGRWRSTPSQSRKKGVASLSNGIPPDNHISPKTHQPQDNQISLKTQNLPISNNVAHIPNFSKSDILQGGSNASCVPAPTSGLDLEVERTHKPPADEDDRLGFDAVRRASDVSLSQKIAELNFSKDSFCSAEESLSNAENRVPTWTTRSLYGATHFPKGDAGKHDTAMKSATPRSEAKLRQEMMLHINRSTQTLLQKVNDRIKNVEHVLDSVSQERGVTLSVRRGCGTTREDSTASTGRPCSNPALLELLIQRGQNSKDCIQHIMPSHLKTVTCSRPGKSLSRNVEDIAPSKLKVPVTSPNDTRVSRGDMEHTSKVEKFGIKKSSAQIPKDAKASTSSTSLSTSSVVSLNTSSSLSCLESAKVGETFSLEGDGFPRNGHRRPRPRSGPGINHRANSGSKKNGPCVRGHREQDCGDHVQPQAPVVKTYDVSAALPVQTTVCSNESSSESESHGSDRHFWWQSRPSSTPALQSQPSSTPALQSRPSSTPALQSQPSSTPALHSWSPARRKTRPKDVASRPDLFQTPKRNTTDPFQTPKRNTTDPFQTPKRNTTDPFQTPKTNTTDPFHTPKRNTTDPFQTPKRNTTDPFQTPKRNTTDPFQTPKRNTTDPFQTPKRNTTDPFQTPKRNTTDPFQTPSRSLQKDARRKGPKKGANPEDARSPSAGPQSQAMPRPKSSFPDQGEVKGHGATPARRPDGPWAGEPWAVRQWQKTKPAGVAKTRSEEGRKRPPFRF